MDLDTLWAAIDDQRLRTAELLDDLSDDEWDTPSLCDGWTVRDVAAHLTLQQMTLGDGLRAAWDPRRHLGGGMNGIINASAKAQAALPTAHLIARIRAMIGSRRHNVGVTPQETLIDIVVHGQDIAVPLGRELGVPPFDRGDGGRPDVVEPDDSAGADAVRGLRRPRPARAAARRHRRRLVRGRGRRGR